MFRILKEKIPSKEINTKKKIVTFLNLYSYLSIRRKSIILESVDVVYIDGFLLVKLLNLLGIKCNRKSFDMSSLAPKVFSEASEKKLSVFIIGTKPKIIDKAIANIKHNFPSLNIIGYRHGYFNNQKEREETLHKIRKLNPDIVICGMGTPLQEEFLVDLRKVGWKGTGYTCGGFLHQTAKRINYYPKWVNKYNLRWLYRLIDEPRLWKRYFIIYPLSITVLLFDFIKYKLER